MLLLIIVNGTWIIYQQCDVSRKSRTSACKFERETQRLRPISRERGPFRGAEEPGLPKPCQNLCHGFAWRNYAVTRAWLMRSHRVNHQRFLT